jgi:hypothetical protein
MRDIKSEAIELARKHYEIEKGITDIFEIRQRATAEAGREGEKIRLLANASKINARHSTSDRSYAAPHPRNHVR